MSGPLAHQYFLQLYWLYSHRQLHLAQVVVLLQAQFGCFVAQLPGLQQVGFSYRHLYRKASAFVGISILQIDTHYRVGYAFLRVFVPHAPLNELPRLAHQTHSGQEEEKQKYE